MSTIQINELQVTNSELNLLHENETGAIVGGRRNIRNAIGNTQIANIFQVNNNVTLQFAFGGGSNFNVTNQTNNAGVQQSIG